MTDILLRLETDPDITIVDGTVEMTDGIESAVILSWIGGAEDDIGLDATARAQWWGNLVGDAAHALRGEVHALLTGQPVTAETLPFISAAASRDIAWLVPAYADEVSVSAELVGARRVEIVARVTTGERMHTVRAERTFA